MLTEPANDDARTADLQGARGVLTAICAGAVIVGLAVGALIVLSAPGGWVMQAANEAILHQQAIATSYSIR